MGILKNLIKVGSDTLKSIDVVSAKGVASTVKFVKAVNPSGIGSILFDTFDTLSYGELKITSFYYGDISASGSTITPTITYSYNRYDKGFSGNIYNPTGFTDGAKVTFSGNGVDATTGAVSAEYLGNTEKDRTEITKATITIEIGSQKVTQTLPVYQEANVKNILVSYGIPSITLGEGLTASGGSAVVTCSVKDNYKYSSGYAYTLAGSCYWKITSGNSRFSTDTEGNQASGSKVNHASMTTNVATDSLIITCYNTDDGSKIATASASIVNAINHKSKSASIGTGITASGGEASVNGSCVGEYTSGSPYSSGVKSAAIKSNGNSRFSVNGTTLKHSNMGSDVTTDTCVLTVTFEDGCTAEASVNVSNYNDLSTHTATATIGTGITAAGGSATISGTCNGTYASGASFSTSTISKVEITSNGNNRFSISGTTLSHSTMGANATTDTCTVKVTFDDGHTATATTSAENSLGTTEYGNYISAYGTPSVSIGSGLTAGASSATVTHSVTNTETYYYHYTSGTADGGHTRSKAGTSTWSITTNGNSRFSQSGNTLSHSKMGTNTGTDSVTITAVNSGDTSNTKTATASVTNTKTKNIGAIKSYGTPTISIGSGITALGGSATVTASVTNVRYYYYTYTDSSANESTTANTENVAGSVTLSIVSNGNSRFSLSGTTLSHSAMTTNETTDACTVRATNAGSTSLYKDASVSATNAKTTVWDGYKSYGTPVVSIGSGITAAASSATVTLGAFNDVQYYHYTYTCSTSNESANAHYANVTGSATWSITSNGNSRFSQSGNTLSHSSMTTNATTDTCVITAVNSRSSSTKNTATVSVTNALGTITYGTPTLSGTLAYAEVSADGATVTPTSTPTYSQSASATYTSGSPWSATYTSGGTFTYSVSGTGFSVSNASTGAITVAANNGAARSATVSVYVTLNGKSSSAKTCTISQVGITALFTILCSDGSKYTPTMDGRNCNSCNVPSGKTPIGICVIPSNHTSDGKARYVSLVNMDYSAPTTGGNGYGIYWGQRGNDLGLTNHEESTAYIETLYSYYGMTTSSNGHYTYSGGTSYPRIYPYNSDGSINTTYRSSTYATCDMDGKSNTDVIIAATTATWSESTISNSYSSGNAPAACCCRRFAPSTTSGLGAGNWYLPSCGEMGYAVARVYEINNILYEIHSSTGIKIYNIYNELYWTSTEAGKNYAQAIYVNYGYTSERAKDYSACFSRAFLAY